VWRSASSTVTQVSARSAARRAGSMYLPTTCNGPQRTG
jgi:hypothetical protein